MDQKSELTIPLPEESSYVHTLSFLRRSPKELLHQLEDDSIFKVIEVEKRPYLFRIEYAPHQLNVRFLNDLPSPEHRQRIETYIRQWLDLDTNLKPFYQLAKTDALLNKLVSDYYGYRIVGQPDLFESLCWAVLGQQINLAFAYTLKGRFVERYGDTVLWEGKPYFLFPHVHFVITIPQEELLSLQFSKQKAAYIIEIARAFEEGLISTESLRGLPLSEAKEILMKIKGIGNWTANYALMKTYRYPDAFPLEDAGLHNAIKNLKKMKAKPSLDQVKRIFKKYKGWEAYATLYLWKSL